LAEDAQQLVTVEGIDFGTMTVDELWRLYEDLSRLLAARLTSEKRELEKRLARLRNDEFVRKFERPHLSVDREHQRRAYPRVLPKYRNPVNPEETWSGRGKQPRWVAAALRAGHHLEELLILQLEDLRNPE
jgi:DNA-binding protein H-NS